MRQSSENQRFYKVLHSYKVYMLESVYITLIVISYFCLIVSLSLGSEKSSKLLSKIFLSGAASILFGALAIGAAKIDVVFCTSNACELQSFFYGDEMGFLFWSFCIISTILFLLYGVIFLAMLIKGAFKNKIEDSVV